mmetsp:Transcript_13860/g.36372  ORF Transcript_13860/g.36372 Transcript_13860/m.36372 type:complete len:118 (+) Transcript_13860:2805-3158(+)
MGHVYYKIHCRESPTQTWIRKSIFWPLSCKILRCVRYWRNGLAQHNMHMALPWKSLELPGMHYFRHPKVWLPWSKCSEGPDRVCCLSGAAMNFFWHRKGCFNNDAVRSMVAPSRSTC